MLFKKRDQIYLIFNNLRKFYFEIPFGELDAASLNTNLKKTLAFFPLYL